MSTEKAKPNEKGELLLDQVRRVMRVRRYSIHKTQEKETDEGEYDSGVFFATG
jgi:hypothetical protein